MNIFDLSTLPHWQLMLIDAIGMGAAIGAIVLAVSLGIRDLRRRDKAASEQADREASGRIAALELQQRLIAHQRKGAR